MYITIGIMIAAVIFSFLWNCFTLWLSAKIIRAPGGRWNNCVQIMYKYIGVAVLTALASTFSMIFLEGTSLIAACILIISMSIYYITRITMENLEISFLMFILLCIIESAIETGFSFALVFVDNAFPFIEQFKEMLEPIAGKF